MHNVSSWCIACIVSAMEFCHTLPFYCFTYDYEDRDLLPQFCIGATRRLIFSPIFLYELFISNTGRKVIVFFYLWIKPKKVNSCVFVILFLQFGLFMIFVREVSRMSAGSK
jgi:prolipoprotein diacylglyceryltransferase